MKAWFLKLHRWVALVFALPLAIVILTGLVLSFEPWVVTSSIEPSSLTPQKIQALLSQHDPQRQVRAIVHRSYDRTLTLGAGRGRGIVVDTATGQVRPQSTLARALGTARGLHETLLIDAGWLVTASTVAMVFVVLLGPLIGWPRFRNTLGGWHTGIGWVLLPLLILSPLTGLMLAFGITFVAPSTISTSRTAPLPLADAVEMVGRDHDLAAMVWMRPLGGRLAVRLAEGGEYRLYAVMPEGMTPMQRNWPRLWHEGNFAGAWSAAMNVIISVAMIGLLVTGVWAWLRRQLRKRSRHLQQAAAT